MAIYPGATWRPITRYKRARPGKPTVVVLHIAVSEASSLYGVFSSSGTVCSHFYVRRDGGVEQYLDTDWQSAADYQGGYRTISIETQGGMGADLANGWTDAQRASMARILAWCHTTHGIPLTEMPNSLRTSIGVGYHRLGVPQKASSTTSLTGGELWSKAAGKVCPGPARIAQVPSIIAAARGASPTPTPSPTPAPTPAPTPSPAPSPGYRYQEDEDMFYIAWDPTGKTAYQVFPSLKALVALASMTPVNEAKLAGLPEVHYDQGSWDNLGKAGFEIFH